MTESGATELLRALLAQQQATQAELRALRLAVEGARYRHRLISDLGRAVALGPTWAGAQQMALILAGVEAAPAGAEPLVDVLRADRACPRSARQLLRILQVAAERAATDSAGRLCQWPANADDPGHHHRPED